jgi:hypothetical protein
MSHKSEIFSRAPLDFNEIWQTCRPYKSEWKCQILAIYTLQNLWKELKIKKKKKTFPSL